MDIVTIDYESFWSPTYSLTKMSPLEYVLGDEFETISCSIKVNNYNTDVFFGEDDVRRAFKGIKGRIENGLLLAHNNSGFDAYISSYVFGLKPKMWGCTAAMARPLHGKTCGVSLAKLVEHYQLGVKNNAILMQTKGRHLADFSEDEKEQMRVYNREDTDQCYALFNKLRPNFTAKELWHIDAITRMRIDPKFEVDIPMLETALSIERDQKRKHILMVAKKLRTTPGFESSSAVMEAATLETLEEAVRAELASAPKFAALLTACGVEVPMKPSPSNPEKQVPALAKTDEAFTDLQEHDDPIVAAAARARLAVKSTLLETRIGKFLVAANLTGGKLPVPIRYCGADTTGRDSGEEYNVQNLPRVNPSAPRTSDALRNCLRAPKGHKIIVSDLSGIEMRVNHFLWKVESSMELFANDVEADLYRDFASARYGVAPEDVDKTQRQMGKVCLSEGTLIMCRLNGRVFWERIELFKPEFQLWDGEEWVWAKGVVSNGWRQTQQLCGIWLTPDHLVLSGTRWTQAQYVRGESLAQALETGAENLSLRELWPSIVSGSPLLSLSAIAGFLSTRWRLTTSRLSRQLGVTAARLSQAPTPESFTGVTQVLSATTGTESDSLTGYLRPSTAAANQRTRRTKTMVGEVSQYSHRGLRTGGSFYGTLSRLKGGTTNILSWIASTATKGTNPGTSGSSQGGTTCSTSAKSLNSSNESRTSKRNSHVYDILDCGPRNRFTVLTDKGPLIVHNCHLGLGFGAGAPTFKRFAKVQYKLDIPEDEAVVIVSEWREKYSAIVQGWKLSGQGFLASFKGQTTTVDPWGMVTSCPEGLRLPSGRLIRYPDLRMEEDGAWPDGRPKRSMFYAHGRHKARITGPKACENIVQAVARDIIFDDALLFYKSTGLRPQLRVHDELVYVVPDSEAQTMLDELQRVMRTPPTWWPELVVWSEGDIAQTYGAAK